MRGPGRFSGLAAVLLSTSVPLQILFHDTGLTIALAALSGVLTAIVQVAACSQETVQLWIRHRVEIVVATRRGQTERAFTKAAVSKNRERRIAGRAAMRPVRLPSVTEVMRLTQRTESTDHDAPRGPVNPDNSSEGRPADEVTDISNRRAKQDRFPGLYFSKNGTKRTAE
jgi:hypothetical protein